MLDYTPADALQAYATGDVPSDPVRITLEDDTWTTATATPGTATIAGAEVSVTLPALTAAGVLTIRLVVQDAAGHRETVAPIRVVVEDAATEWHTLATVRDEWQDAPDDDVELFELLTTARRDCERVLAHVVTGELPETVTADHRKAQRLQAASIWAASRSTTDNRLGGEEYGVTVFPLDWHVQQLLRPRAAGGGMW